MSSRGSSYLHGCKRLGPHNTAGSSLCSPGRTSGTFDNEVVMMNHVYKERFPKVTTAAGGMSVVMPL